MHVYLACFDITDDKSRYRVAKLLGTYGNRVQKSVFEVRFKRPSQIRRVQKQIAALLDADDDCRFYFLCKSCRSKSVDSLDRAVATFPAAIVI